MRVIEQSVVAKSESVECEDVVVVTDSHAAVIDGTTTKGPKGQSSGGRLAASAVATAVAELAEDSSIEIFLEKATANVRGLWTDGSRDSRWPAGSLAASAIVYSAGRHEVWAVGDGWVGLDSQPLRFDHAAEQHAAHARALFTALQLEGGARLDMLLRQDPGREFIMPLLMEEYRFRNHPDSDWGYAGIDGHVIPPHLVKRVPVPDDANHVTIATDGYPVMGRTLLECEEALADILDRDPLMISIEPATKCCAPEANSFDDRAYVRLAV